MDIDFVVLWVDSNDPEWQAQYRHYRKEEHLEDRGRFRDWDIFRYWFRAVEQYAPWVRKVFLVTNGKFPDWINPDHPKLVLVKHEDYMPAEVLPVFNSGAIELFISRIPGLSEHFVYFNDDMYLNAPVTPDYYFHDGLPCDSNEEWLFTAAEYCPIDHFNVAVNQYICMAVVNRHFSRCATVRQSPGRWFGWYLGRKQLRVGIRQLLVSLLFRGRSGFEGFKSRHWEQPFLKSVLDEVLAKEPELVRKSCTRFREDTNLLQYIFRYWQFASNRFYPVCLNEGICYYLDRESNDAACRTLLEGKMKSVCLNDAPNCTDEDYRILKPRFIEVFEKKFPEKSSFEL